MYFIKAWTATFWFVCVAFCVASSRIKEDAGTGGAMVLGNLPVPGRPTIWMIVGQGPTALAVSYFQSGEVM